MKQKTSIVNNTGTNYLRIPPALMKYLELDVGQDSVEIEDFNGKYGKYCAFWKSKDSK